MCTPPWAWTGHAPSGRSPPTIRGPWAIASAGPVPHHSQPPCHGLHSQRPCQQALSSLPQDSFPPIPTPPPPPFPHTIWPHLGLPALHRRSAEAGLPAHQEPLLHERFLRVMPASIGLENVRPLPGMPRPSVSREEVGPPPPCRSSAVHLMLAMRSKRSGPYSRGWAAPPLSLPGLVIPAASITRCTAASAAPRSGKCADSWQVRPSACP